VLFPSLKATNDTLQRAVGASLAPHTDEMWTIELLLKPSWHGRWHRIAIIVIAEKLRLAPMLGTDILRRSD
jgi:hypothetical protein